MLEEFPRRRIVLLISLLALILPLVSQAASHREAPAILSSPQVDSTDFYAFRSYEPGRAGFVTLIANYNPLQAPYGGPNYFSLDPDAAYDIHVTNDGDGVEDLTFRFLMVRVSPEVSLLVGDAGNTETVPVPLVNVGPVGGEFGTANVNERRLFRLQLIRGPVDAPTEKINIVNPRTGGGLFGSPLDYVGEKSFPDYESYANWYIHDLDIPGCGASRMFVGPRKESFSISLGEVFDLVNLDPLGDVNGETNDTEDFNISTLALEVPIDCLTDSGPVIGAWTTASKRKVTTLGGEVSYGHPAAYGGGFVQVSRLGNPLVNELAIGLPDKDRFNASQPEDDGQFLRYVTHPSLPELLEILFGVTAPNLFPREDLVQIFLTGVPGLNQDGSVAEVMRLNTEIAATAAGDQNSLGVVGGDLAGYPNGRRPGDDVVDISLRAMMGVLLTPDVAPNGQLPYTDGVLQHAGQFTESFPYLLTPLSGTRD